MIRGRLSGNAQAVRLLRQDLTLGGTILGTSRTALSAHARDRRRKRRGQGRRHEGQTYKDLKLDCLVTLGGNGTHKTANLLSEEGLNVIGLPKTIDNDICGTEVTFGFHTAVDIATDVIDRIHTTATSHGRVMVIEIMGNKAGWLTLYTGVAGGADVILLPEITYDINNVARAVNARANSKKSFSIIAVAEGAMSVEESKMKKEREAYRASLPYDCISKRIAAQPGTGGRGGPQRGSRPHPARRQPQRL